MNTATIKWKSNHPYSDLYIDQRNCSWPYKRIFFWQGQIKLPKINQYSGSKGPFINRCDKFESGKLKDNGDTRIILQSDEHYVQMFVKLWSKVWYMVLQ